VRRGPINLVGLDAPDQDVVKRSELAVGPIRLRSILTGRSRGVVHGHIRALRGTGVLSPPLSSVSGASVAARARSVLAPARPAAPGVGDGLQYNAYHVLGSLLQTSLDVSIRLSFLSRQQWARAGRALGR
jgi:hypothetical protein